MPYRSPHFVTNCHYHLYNRGVAKQPIFYDLQDYKHFKMYMKTYRKYPSNPEQDDVFIETYCLMPNHFHMLVKQTNNKGITRYLQRFLTAYSMYFNYKYDRVGPLYQGRTKAKWVKDEKYFKEISRYIHRNPMKLFLSPLEFLTYPYSNLQYYLTNSQANSSLLLSFFDNDPERYKQFILQIPMGSPDLPI